MINNFNFLSAFFHLVIYHQLNPRFQELHKDILGNQFCYWRPFYCPFFLAFPFVNLGCLGTDGPREWGRREAEVRCWMSLEGAPLVSRSWLSLIKSSNSRMGTKFPQTFLFQGSKDFKFSFFATSYNFKLLTMALNISKHYLSQPTGVCSYVWPCLSFPIYSLPFPFLWKWSHQGQGFNYSHALWLATCKAVCPTRCLR